MSIWWGTTTHFSVTITVMQVTEVTSNAGLRRLAGARRGVQQPHISGFGGFAMAEQNFLVKIKKQYRAAAVKALCERIHQWQGRILLMTDAGYVIVIRIDDSFRNAILAQPEVDMVGGIQVTQRQIRHIRVGPLDTERAP